MKKDLQPLLTLVLAVLIASLVGAFTVIENIDATDAGDRLVFCHFMVILLYFIE